MLHHDLQSLRIFVAACELKSVTKAADRFNIALSAASRRIQLLERETGTPLIIRLSHGIKPTAAGMTVLRYARDVLQLGQKLETGLDEHRVGLRGYLRIYASSSVLVERAAADLAQFAKSHPEIKLDLEERPSVEVLEALINRQADIGLIVRGVEPNGITTLDYGNDQLSVAVPRSHPFVSRKQLHFIDVVGEDLVALEGSSAIYHLLAERARDANRLMRVRVQVRSFGVMCVMISQGLGIGILPESGSRPFARPLGLRLVTLAEPWAQRGFAICVRSLEEIEPAGRLLIDYLTGRSRRPQAARA